MTQHNLWRSMAALLLATLMMVSGLAAAEGTDAAVVADLTTETTETTE